MASDCLREAVRIHLRPAHSSQCAHIVRWVHASPCMRAHRPFVSFFFFKLTGAGSLHACTDLSVGLEILACTLAIASSFSFEYQICVVSVVVDWDLV